jgi:C4-dicarboxylate transporter DctM subunit
MIWVVAAVFVACMVFGMPIVFALGIPGAIYILLSDLPVTMIPAKMFSGVDVFVLLAIPMFIVAGNLMNFAGISKRLIRFSMAMVGSLPGGLAMVNIVSLMFCSGVTGAASADIAAVGSILIPAMRKQGYSDGFSAALTSVASSMGPIIPPSILFVVYGFLANVSIASLFLAGVVPGVVICLAMMITVYVLAKKHHYPRGDRFSFSVLLRETKSASLALLLPVIIVGGMGLGVMTPTEVSGVAVILSFVFGKFIYKELQWRDIPGILAESAILSGAVVFIVATKKNPDLVDAQCPASVPGRHRRLPSTYDSFHPGC